MDKLLGQASKVFQFYEKDIKKRQDGSVVFECPDGRVVSTFVKDGHEFSSGGRTGKCGSVKDHRRVYVCD